MIVKTFLVVGQNPNNGKVSVRRAVARYPGLDWNEAVLELQLEIPDDTFEAPLFTVEIDKRHLEVSVEPQPVEK